MSFTPFNAHLLSPLLGDMELAQHFSVKSDVECMLSFEVALAVAQAEAGMIPDDAAAKINEACGGFEPDMGALQIGVERDGMAVPEFIAQLRRACDEASEFLHLGTTSQDVIDTSLTLRLQRVNSILRKRLVDLVKQLANLDRKFGKREMMGHTRMQPALPIRVSHRLSNWSFPLEKQLASLDQIERELHVVQLGGAVGDLKTMAEKAEAVRRKLAKELGLNDPGRSWHTDRSCLIAYCNWLAQTCAQLGKIGQDFLLMARDGSDEFSFHDAGGSSAMAHKQNPIRAEALVAQARFVATLAGGMQQAAIHEQERSGSAWTLEWMIIPQITIETGASLKNAARLLGTITSIGK